MGVMRIGLLYGRRAKMRQTDSVFTVQNTRLDLLSKLCSHVNDFL